MSTPWLLVVEDDPGLRELVTLAAREVTGLAVEAAANGVEALRTVQDKLPAVVLTDLMMPRMSGFELLANLRAGCPDLPLIAMSAAESAGEALRAGFNSFLAKPFELEELAAALERWLALS